MRRVNHEEEIIITGKVRPRMIKSEVNSCLGGTFWRINYLEEKVWGKDGANKLFELIRTKMRTEEPLLQTFFSQITMGSD